MIPLEENSSEIKPQEPVKDTGFRADSTTFEDDIVKYVITDRLAPNKISLATKKELFILYGNLYKGIQDQSSYSGLAHLFIPETLKAIETIVSLVHLGIFGNPIFMRYRGVEESDDVSARNMTDLNYYEMSENQFELQFTSFERQLCIYGTAVRRILWDFKEREVTTVNLETKKPEKKLETYRDTWTFEDVDILNFWIPPETPWYDIQQAEWLAETQEVSEVWLRAKIKSKWISKDKGLSLLRENAINPSNSNETSPGYYLEQRLKSSNIQASTSKQKKFGITTWYGWIPAKYIKSKDSTLEDDDLVLGLVIIGNDKTILKLELVADIFWHNRYPYVSCGFLPIEGEFFSMGVPQVTQSLQCELNDTRNQTMDNKTVALKCMWLLDRAAQIKETDLIFRPNGVIKTNDMNGLTALRPPLFTGVGITIEGVIKEDIRQSVSAISGLQGIPQPGVGSATEFQGLQNSSMSRNRMIIKTVAECTLKPTFTLAKFYNYQFYDRRKLIRLIGEKGIKTRLLDRDDIVGNYDIELELATDFEKNPNVLRQHLLTAFSQLVNLPPQVIKFHWKLISQLLKEVGVKNPEEYYPDLIPESDEVLLTPDEEHEVFLEAQPVKVRRGDNDVEHLQSHITLRNSIYLALPPYILELLDTHIKDHMKQHESKKQSAMQQQAVMMAQGNIPGQTPDGSPNTMQSPGTDNEILKGVENV